MPKILLITLLLVLSSCLFNQKVTIKGQGGVKLTEVDYQTLNGWQEDDHKKALQSFLHSCNKFAKMAQSRSIGRQIAKITVEDFRDVCDIAQIVKTMSSKQAKNFFENWFSPFLVEDREKGSRGIFTGYYEASLNGSKIKSEKFQYPLYKKPQGLDGNEPYLTRAEIENGALKNKDLELIYVDDKVDLFFMHIQGSGRVTLENGSEIRVGFAARNNQPFIAIANYMADKGYLDRGNLNAATIKDWLRANPDKADEVMNINTAYTFFRFSDGEYIVGAQNVPLTAERSMAVDKSIIPYGLPIWVETQLKKKDKTKEQYSHLLIAQDTGSAIKGAVRGDIFFGHGREAEEKAYYMASAGQYYLLLPINIVDKIVGR